MLNYLANYGNQYESNCKSNATHKTQFLAFIWKQMPLHQLPKPKTCILENTAADDNCKTLKSYLFNHTVFKSNHKNHMTNL